MALLVYQQGEERTSYGRIEPRSLHVSEDHYNELVADQKLLNTLKTALKRLIT